MADVGYMDMVMILNRLIHAERAGVWGGGHLVEVENILTYYSSSWSLKLCVVPFALPASNDKSLHD